MMTMPMPSDVLIRTLAAVEIAGDNWRSMNRWVTAYDIAEPLRLRAAHVGLSVLPPVARMGYLDTIRRPGCTVMYRLNTKGRYVLNAARVAATTAGRQH